MLECTVFLKILSPSRLDFFSKWVNIYLRNSVIYSLLIAFKNIQEIISEIGKYFKLQWVHSLVKIVYVELHMCIYFIFLKERNLATSEIHRQGFLQSVLRITPGCWVWIQASCMQGNLFIYWTFSPALWTFKNIHTWYQKELKSPDMR